MKTRTIVWLVLALLLALLGWHYAPYALFYVLPFVAISVGLGLGWLISCRDAPEERRYARLAVLIPASVGIV